jgi:hypothetical protein
MKYFLTLLLITASLTACNLQESESYSQIEDEEETTEEKQNTEKIGNEKTDDASKVETEVQNNSNRPETKQDTLMIEGMEEEFSFHLHHDEVLGLSTYIIDPMVAESASSGEGDAMIVRNADSTVLFHIFSPPNNHELSLDGLLDLSISTMEANGLLITEMTEQEFQLPLADDGIRYSLVLENNEKQGYFGHILLFEKDNKKYRIMAYYPFEYADGYNPRFHQFLIDLEWNN